jgi:hypothetical protein
MIKKWGKIGRIQGKISAKNKEIIKILMKK